MPPSGIVTRWRLANGRLASYQDGLLTGLLVVGIALCLLVVVVGLRALCEAVVGAEEQEPQGILWEGAEPRDTDLAAAEYKQAGAQGANAEKEELEAPKSAVPHVDWSDRALRRRAASMLCLHGDLRNALDLLPAEDPDRDELFGITRFQQEKVLHVLESVLAKMDETGLQGDSTGSSRPGRSLRRCAELLPENLLLDFVTSLHWEVRTRTGASDAHLRLLLEAAFPPGAGARKIYLESSSPRPRSSFPELLDRWRLSQHGRKRS